MVITKENIGDVICQYNNGERFKVQNISDNVLFIQKEDGTYASFASCIVAGGVEYDEARIASFHTNLSLARVLNAAQAAVERRFTPDQYDVVERQNASRVSEVVAEQRAEFSRRLQTNRQTLKAGHALADQFLNDLIQKAPGTTDVFFGAAVQYHNDAETISFSVDHAPAQNMQAAKVLLSERTAEPPTQAMSFDDLVKSATDRAKQQHHESSNPFFK